MRQELVELRNDLHRRFNPDTDYHLTWLELRQYQVMMKRVNAADPFLKRS